MNPFIDAQKPLFSASIEHFKQELSQMRTGQANPELIDSVLVESYETMMPIKQLATITTPDTKTIMIAPWDKSLLKPIEKAITSANLGYTPVNDGEVVRIPMPPMTEENRKDLVKILNQKAEKARVTIRQVRDKVKESILHSEKEKEITEDDKFRYLKQLEDFTGQKVDEINELAEKKAERIMTI